MPSGEFSELSQQPDQIYLESKANEAWDGAAADPSFGEGEYPKGDEPVEAIELPDGFPEDEEAAVEARLRELEAEIARLRAGQPERPLLEELQDPGLPLPNDGGTVVDNRRAETSRPFVDQRNQQADLSNDDMERAVQNQHALIQHAKEVGDPILQAARDKSPIGEIPRDPVTWETTDNDLPGAVYRFSAKFVKADDPDGGSHPSLSRVSCVYVPDIEAERHAEKYDLNKMTKESHPLTVTATFDGPDMTGIELVFPNRSTTWSSPVEGRALGPAWQKMAAETRDDGLLGRLATYVSGGNARGKESRYAQKEGYIGLDLSGHQPRLIAKDQSGDRTPRRTIPQKLMRLNPVAPLMDRMNEAGNRHLFATRWLKSSTYVADNDSFVPIATLPLAHGSDSQPIPASEVKQLMTDIASFFPLMPDI